jgi:hypothetical protein
MVVIQFAHPLCGIPVNLIPQKLAGESVVGLFDDITTDKR